MWHCCLPNPNSYGIGVAFLWQTATNEIAKSKHVCSSNVINHQRTISGLWNKSVNNCQITELSRYRRQHRKKIQTTWDCNNSWKCSPGYSVSVIMNNMLNQYFKSLYMTITGQGQMIRRLWLIILQHFPGKKTFLF